MKVFGKLDSKNPYNLAQLYHKNTFQSIIYSSNKGGRFNEIIFFLILVQICKWSITKILKLGLNDENGDRYQYSSLKNGGKAMKLKK